MTNTINTDIAAGSDLTNVAEASLPPPHDLPQPKPFVYKSLGNHPHAFRHVIVHGFDLHGYVKCSIKDSIQGQDAYCALSYVWGSDLGHFEIMLDGCSFFVTSNLWSFLRHAAREGNGLLDARIWIDAICIDQNSAAEKSRQVPLMGNIFSHAYKVVAWLPNMHYALQSYDKNLDPNMRGAQLLAQATNGKIESLPMLESHASLAFEALLRLIGHRIWSRLWVVQEITLAEQVELLWEGQCVLWAGLRGLLLALSHPEGEQTAISKILLTSSRAQIFHALQARCPIFGFFEKTRTQGGAVPLRDLVCQFSKHSCTLVHDRVFALLSLAHDGPLVQPHYDESLFSMMIRLLKTQNFWSNTARTASYYESIGKVLALDPSDGVEIEIIHQGDDLTKYTSPVLLSSGEKLYMCPQCWKHHTYLRAGLVAGVPSLYAFLVFLPGIDYSANHSNDGYMSRPFTGITTLKPETEHDHAVLHIDHWLGYARLAKPPDVRYVRESRSIRMIGTWDRLHELLKGSLAHKVGGTSSKCHWRFPKESSNSITLPHR